MVAHGGGSERAKSAGHTWKGGIESALCTLKHLARFSADEADAADLFAETISPNAPKELGESLSLATAPEDSESI